MNRRFYFGLILISALAGYPYASLVLYRVIGTSAVVFTERNGTQRSLISGPAAPLPDWVPILPGSLTIGATYWPPTPDRPIAGGVELLTHKGVDDIKQFYLDALRGAKFDARDIGFGLLNAQNSAFFGVENELLAYRADTDVTLSVSTSTPSGLLLRPRLVKLHWQQWGARGVELREKLFAQSGGAATPDAK